jgi:hypothetical protein
MTELFDWRTFRDLVDPLPSRMDIAISMRKRLGPQERWERVVMRWEAKHRASGVH